MLNWLKRKSSFPVTFAQLFQGLKPNWFSNDYISYSSEGYCKNVVAYHCINKIAKAVADIPYIVKINGKEAKKNDIITLLQRPNPYMGYKRFMETAIKYRLINGNIYILAMNAETTKGKILQLDLLRPDRIYIQITSWNIPVAYQYTINGKMTEYPIDYATGMSDILQIKEFNPLNDFYGLSPISAAAYAIGQHNEAAEWNKKLLQNSARPSGMVVVKSGEQLTGLTDKQLQKLRDEFDERYTGPGNAGKAMFMSGDVSWQSLGMSPSDMDWLNGKNSSARDVCLAFGYPAMLLGLPDGATFNNVDAAKLSLYEETVVPLARDTLDEIANYLSHHTPYDVTIELDIDQVSALAPRRAMARQSARDDAVAGIITPNEARAENGYPPIVGADDLLVPAGKLPLNFDASGESKDDSTGEVSDAQTKYKGYLLLQGYSEERAQKIAEIAHREKSK